MAWDQPTNKPSLHREYKYTATCNGEKEAKNSVNKGEYRTIDTIYFSALHHKLNLSCKRDRKASFIEPISLPQSCGDTAILTLFHYCSARKQPVWQKQMDSTGRNSNGPQTQPRHCANSAVNERGSGDRGSCWTWNTFVSPNPKQLCSFYLQITSETVFKNTIFKLWGTKCGIKRASIYRQTSFCHVITWSHQGASPFNTWYSRFAQEIPVTEHHIPAPTRAKFQLCPVTLALPGGKTLRSGFIILNWKIKSLSNTTSTFP